MKIVAQNKKAYHDYFILESYEAGIELKGTEIKSVRKGSANLKDSYVRIKNGEAFVVNMHIAPYEQGNMFNVDSRRERKILLHKKEINKLSKASESVPAVPLDAAPLLFRESSSNFKTSAAFA